MQHSSEYFGANHCRIPASISAVITAVFPWAFRRQLLKHFSEHFNGNLWPDFCAICALCAWMLRLCLLQSYAHCCNGSRPLFLKRAARASRLLLQRLQGPDFCAICALCAWMLRLCLLQSYAQCCNGSRPLFLKRAARASRLLLQRLQGADFCAICALCAWMLRLCLLQSYVQCCNGSKPYNGLTFWRLLWISFYLICS